MLGDGTSRSAADAVRFLADGQYRNPAGEVDACTTSYFHRPEDLAAEVTDAGLRLDGIVGANGIVKLLLPDLAERLADGATRSSGCSASLRRSLRCSGAVRTSSRSAAGDSSR